MWQVKRGNEINKQMGMDKQCRSIQVGEERGSREARVYCDCTTMRFAAVQSDERFCSFGDVVPPFVTDGDCFEGCACVGGRAACVAFFLSITHPIPP